MEYDCTYISVKCFISHLRRHKRILFSFYNPIKKLSYDLKFDSSTTERRVSSAALMAFEPNACLPLSYIGEDGVNDS